MKSQVGGRLVFENAKAALTLALMNGKVDNKANRDAIADQVANAVLSQSFLRIETLLTNNATNFSFPVLNNQNNGAPIRPTEFRLNQQDAFFCAGLKVEICAYASAVDVDALPQSYPNPITFPTGAASLGAFYNGRLKLTVNNSVIVPAMDIIRFMVIPQTQLTAATNSPHTEYIGAGEDSPENIIEPNLLFIGSKNSQLDIILPGNIATIDAFTYARIEILGVLMQNVTVVS